MSDGPPPAATARAVAPGRGRIRASRPAFAPELLEAVRSGSFCPYRGLIPYGEHDQPFFVGRESETETIVANLHTCSLTLLYGGSGVGKTSVLQAGVIPSLRQLGRGVVVLFREWQTPEFEGQLAARILRTALDAGRERDADFAEVLKHRLAERLWLLLGYDEASAPDWVVADAATAVTGVDEQRPRAADAETAVWDPAGAACAELPLDAVLDAAARALGQPVLLVFDQFEEYFLYHPATTGDTGFEAELARAVNRGGHTAHFLLCMREEGLSKLDRFRIRIPNLMTNLLRLEPLDGERARRVIEEPLATYNRLREGDELPRMELGDGLVDALLSQRVTFDQDGRGGTGKAGPAREQAEVELPFLQLVLTALWEAERKAGSTRLRREMLLRMGGAEGVMRTHLAAALGHLSPRQRVIAARVFWYLVTPSRAKIAYAVEDLAEVTGYTRAEVHQVLLQLASGDLRILRRIDPAPGTPQEIRYEITHDALAAPVLDWRTRFERMRQLRRDLLIGASVLVAVLLLLFVVRQYRHQAALDAFIQRDSTERQTRSRELAALALALIPVAPDSAEAAATRAYQIAPGPAAEYALRAARLENRQLGVKTGLPRLHALALNRRGTLLALGGEDRQARVLDAGGLRTFGPHGEMVYDVALSGDSLLGTGSRDDTARVFRVATGALLRRYPHSSNVLGLAFSADGRFLLTASADNWVRVWNVARDTLANRFRPGGGEVTAITVDWSGRWVATGTEEGLVRIWPFPGGRDPERLPALKGLIQRIRFSRDGTRLLVACSDDTARVWDRTRAKWTAVFAGHDEPVFDASWSPDERMVVTASRDRTVRVWDVVSGQQVAVLRGHNDWVYGAEFMPGGDSIVSVGADRTLRFWTAPKTPGVFVGVSDSASGERVAPGGRARAAWSTPRTLEIISGARHLSLNTDSIRDARFTPDGRWLVVALPGDSAWVLDPRNGASVGTARGRGDARHRFVFTPDKEWVVAAWEKGAVQVFPCTVCEPPPLRLRELPPK